VELYIYIYKLKRDQWFKWFIIDCEVKYCGLSQYIYLLPFSTENNWLANEVKLSFLSDLKVICKLIGDNLIGLLFFFCILKLHHCPCKQKKNNWPFVQGLFCLFYFICTVKWYQYPWKLKNIDLDKRHFLVFSVFCCVP
jgi:hypothetical protein